MGLCLNWVHFKGSKASVSKIINASVSVVISVSLSKVLNVSASKIINASVLLYPILCISV